MLPLIILAVVAVPLLVIAAITVRRSSASGEHPAGEDEHARELMEQEFAESEEYQAEWREQERARRRDSLL